MFLVPFTSSSPCRQDTAPLAPSFIMQPICGPKPVNTHYGNWPRLPTAAQCCWVPTHSQPRGLAAQRGCQPRSGTQAPLQPFKLGMQPLRGSGLRCGHCQSPWVEETQLSYHHHHRWYQVPAEYANGGGAKTVCHLPIQPSIPFELQHHATL